MSRALGPIREGQLVVGDDWLSISYGETVVDSRKLRYAQTNRLGEKRLKTLFTKEPTTIAWLDSFRAGQVLVDIGANVGLYSIYAAVMRGATVHAFEPEALNYAELNKNVFINGLHGQVLAYCVAITDEDRVDRLFLGGFAEGMSHHDFGENTWSEDKNFGAVTTSKDSRLVQGCVGFRLDTLVERGVIPIPDHVKIDVDGLEHRVVEGAWNTFQSPALKSVLIEIDHRIPKCRDIVDRMLSLGWRYSINQVRANRKVTFTPEDIARMREQGKGGFNYIFYKDEAYDRLFDAYIATYVPPMAPKAADSARAPGSESAVMRLRRRLRIRSRLKRLFNLESKPK